MNESDPKHDQKLFDKNALESERQFIKEGRLYDISLERGLLINVKKNYTPYIGNQ